MGADGSEIEDARVRLLVRLDGAPAAATAEAIRILQEADRLAGLIAWPEPAIADYALTLPTALLLDREEPQPGTAGAIVACGREPDMAVEQARRAWGADAILIADVGISRHDAMEAGEAGADAVLFSGSVDGVCDCIRWWRELFVLPSAAPAAPDSLDGLVGAGADFLIIEGSWLVDGTLDPAALVERLAVAERRRGTPGASREAERDEDQR